jgi:hypothetical protein
MPRGMVFVMVQTFDVCLFHSDETQPVVFNAPHRIEQLRLAIRNGLTRHNASVMVYQLRSIKYGSVAWTGNACVSALAIMR